MKDIQGDGKRGMDVCVCWWWRLWRCGVMEVVEVLGGGGGRVGVGVVEVEEVWGWRKIMGV